MTSTLPVKDSQMCAKMQMWISEMKSILLLLPKNRCQPARFCQHAVLSYLSAHPLPFLLLVFFLPTLEQFIEVPVQLLDDDVIPVNNSPVSLCRTCFMPTVLAQQSGGIF